MFTIAAIRNYLGNDGLSLKDLARRVIDLQDMVDPAWIVAPTEEALAREVSRLERLRDLGGTERLSLFGVPFAVKDNIDVEGFPTSAACPDFAYIAQCDAECVRLLKEQGAMFVGKANLDQFATGLSGTRSPYGEVPNAFRAEYISGGSSSGSASLVARGRVCFALGTDTAGSGRIPAGMNGVVGCKPSRGLISTSGVVPACRSLDCVSIFTANSEDALLVLSALAEHDPKDIYSRTAPGDFLGRRFGTRPRFAVPHTLEHFGDEASRRAFRESIELLSGMGVTVGSIDFSPFVELARLLYEGPWIAERDAAYGDFVREHPDAVLPVIRELLSRSGKFSAKDYFEAEYRRRRLVAQIQDAMADVDALVVPTVTRAFTRAEMNNDPIAHTASLGYYSNFVNLADLSALSLPAGHRADGLPHGFTLVARAFDDVALLELAHRFQAAHPWKSGASEERVARPGLDDACPKGWVRVAVVGAHLSGMPLNHQLTERGARLVKESATAASYRLYELAGSVPAKPGLVRAEAGSRIGVEVWELPSAEYGSFVALIPSPLCVGRIELEDGSWVQGFLCESWALGNAKEISEYGGWKAYLAQKR